MLSGFDVAKINKDTGKAYLHRLVDLVIHLIHCGSTDIGLFLFSGSPRVCICLALFLCTALTLLSRMLSQKLKICRASLTYFVDKLFKTVQVPFTFHFLQKLKNIFHHPYFKELTKKECKITKKTSSSTFSGSKKNKQDDERNFLRENLENFLNRFKELRISLQKEKEENEMFGSGEREITDEELRTLDAHVDVIENAIGF